MIFKRFVHILIIRIILRNRNMGTGRMGHRKIAIHRRIVMT